MKLSKRQKVEFLLDHWQDFHETLYASDIHADDVDDAVTLMPRMSRHPSVRELLRAVGLTRQAMPNKCAHMMAVYTAEWRNTTRMEKQRRKRGKTELVERRVRERVVPAWVRRQKAEDAFDHVVLSFRGEVFIPDELLELIAA